jgi:hypothetical protein
LSGFANAFFKAVNCPEQVQPTPGDPNESFIDVPGGRFRFQVSTQPPVYFRPVSLNPTPDGGVIHRQTALHYQLLNIPQTQGKPEVPAYTRHNDDRLKLTFSEQRWSAGSHLVNLPNALMQHFPFTLLGDPKKLFEASYAQVSEATRALVKRAFKPATDELVVEALVIAFAVMLKVERRRGSRISRSSSRTHWSNLVNGRMDIRIVRSAAQRGWR